MLRPIKDFVVIQRDEREERTPGGLHVPDTAQQKVTRGRVIAVGPGLQQESLLADVIEQAIETSKKTGALPPLVETLERVVQQLRQLAPQVQEGDRVLFGKYTGNEVQVKGPDGAPIECVVTRDAELFGVIDP